MTTDISPFLKSPDFPAPTETTRIIVVANQKGGVGKTTTTVNLAAALAEDGKTVLVIDLDPQGNASTALGIDKRSVPFSIYDVLINGMPLDDAMKETAFSNNLYCVASTIDLAGAEVELVSLVAREKRLKNAIAASEMAFDYILIDCPPSLGLLTTNALTAGREILVPIQCEYYALEGVGALMKTVGIIQQHLNEELHISSVLLTMFNLSLRLSREVAKEVRAYFPEQLMQAKIPRSTKMGEAPSHGETILSYDPTGKGAKAYREAARELAARGAQ